MPNRRRWPAGRVDHVDNVDHRPTVASRPYRRLGRAAVWTMWTIGQQAQAVRAWTVWTMWTIGQQARAVRACVDLWTMWTMWTMSCKSSTPFGTWARDVRAVTTVWIYSIYILSLSRLSTLLSTLSTKPPFHWARTWTTHPRFHGPRHVHALSNPDYFVGLLHCAKKSFTLASWQRRQAVE